VAAGGTTDGDVTSDVANPDGTRGVTITGTIAAGSKPALWPYAVPDPVRFAEVVLAEALHERGIVAAPAQQNETVDFAALAPAYTDANVVAEHVSPPFSEDAKVTLKVSQNLHASMLPYVLSAVIAKKPAPQAGFDLEREWMLKGGLDVGGAAQGDGAGAHGHFTPDFMVSWLAFIAKQDFYKVYFDALPVLGKDGTLYDIQVKSPAAGFVHAKTGTFDDTDRLNQADLVTAKALAGYFTRADGHRFAFAIFLNRVDVKGEGAITRIAGQAVGEIAAAGFLAK
jgi:D-alanyl-D-alanine carboxypeptidase/D-alanyl-D-alanine-endopeptidase (penicillin-binding protein 4)